MAQDAILSIADLERLARRRLPRLLFDVIESGVEDEIGLKTNAEAFQRQRFLPRVCAEVSRRSQRSTLMGKTFAGPFGVAPTGIAGVFRRGAETMLATAAKEAGLPLILSGASMVSLERIAAISPETTWFQLYPARDPAITRDLLRRAEAAGMAGLVLTLDNPVSPKRERDARNGFRLPMRLRPGLVLDAVLHPAWLLRYFMQGGLPVMENWAPYAPAGASAGDVAQFFRSQSPIVQTWDDIEAFRQIWPRKLIVKGIMHPDDAVRAASLGIDGIIVSNHGGKALDRVPSALDLLPAVRQAVPKGFPVMIDGSIRRGADVVAALCLGASFVFTGRATLYAVAAAGYDGVRRAMQILQEEIDTTLALIGCSDVADLGPQYLFPLQPGSRDTLNAAREAATCFTE
ncbi:L-lactate dehydrogenase (cytochrome)/(S)-mandelate dehydrogenase [Bosea sp. AK1]|uniref:alpha-hydroxy acid oxidase n=1 Tax=Bosea sp. AK1 TaxID=2587160 RepID=UPI0011517446|nr:alpha-hydroxy acid oxidase [Bosea sp. AK1]TQI65359.1 L-lactate dehydrogenase (cytochrome)/(S)-mandelate dehydrogenase [Bosea sp. AK1]